MDKPAGNHPVNDEFSKLMCSDNELSDSIMIEITEPGLDSFVISKGKHFQCCQLISSNLF